MGQFLDSSIFILLLRFVYSCWIRSTQKIADVYSDSHTFGILKKIFKKTKIYFGYSHLAMILDIRKTSPVVWTVLDNNRMLQRIINLYKKNREKIIRYFDRSFVTALVKNIQKGLYASPVSIISLVMIIAVLVNSALLFILPNQAGLWGWFIRAVFFLVGLSGLFCKLDWEHLKKNSFLINGGFIKNASKD